MTRYGCFLATEEHGPAELVRQARRLTSRPTRFPRRKDT